MAVDIKKTILVELGIEKTQFLTDAASTQKQISALAEEQKKLKVAGQESTVEFQENASQLRLLKQELSTAQRSASNFEKSITSQTGSLAQQKAELSILTAEYDKYSAAEKETSDEAKTLAEAIRKTSDNLKAEESALGNNTRNVGNYQGAIDNLKGTLGGYISQNSEVSSLYNGLQEGLKVLNDITVQFSGNQETLNKVIDAHKKLLNDNKIAQQAKTAADVVAKEAALAEIAATEGKITANELAIIQARAQTLAIEAQTAATVVQTSAINLNIVSLKLLRLALISTGIGAIIVILGSLIAFLLSTQEGIDKVTSVTRPLVAIFKSLLGVAQNLGKSLFEAFSNPKQLLQDLLKFLEGQVINRVKSIAVIFDGIKNFDTKKLSDGLFQLTTGVTNVTDKVQAAASATGKFLADAAKKGAEIDRLSKEIDKSQLRYNENQIKVNDAIDKQLLISKDISRTFTEREKAAREIIRLSKANGEEEEKIIQKKIQRLKIEQSLNDTGREGKQELIDLQIEIRDEAKCKIKVLVPYRLLVKYS
jgi:chromosome segregation ATPase